MITTRDTRAASGLSALAGARSRPGGTRRRFLWSASAAALLTGAASPLWTAARAAAAPMPAALGAPGDVPWFNLLPAAAADWALTPDPADAMRFTLARRDAAAGGGEKRVLVLFTKASSSFDTAMQSILQQFSSRGVPATFTVANTGNDPALGRAWLGRAADEAYDLVFSMGSDATSFVAASFQGAPVPVVTVCSKDPVLRGQVRDYDSGSGTNIAYTSLDVPVEVQLAYLKTIKRDLRTMTIISSKNNKSALETQVEPLRRAAPEHGFTVLDVQVQVDAQAAAEIAAMMPGAMDEAAKLDPGQANSIVWVPGDTTVFNQIATINRFAGKVPVVSAVPDVVKEGDDSAALSIGVGFESNAQLAALYGLNVLTGKAKPGALKVGVVSPPDIAINFRRARAIGLKIPFSFLEIAGDVYDYEGKLVRKGGQLLDS